MYSVYIMYIYCVDINIYYVHIITLATRDLWFESTKLELFIHPTSAAAPCHQLEDMKQAVPASAWTSSTQVVLIKTSGINQFAGNIYICIYDICIYICVCDMCSVLYLANLCKFRKFHSKKTDLWVMSVKGYFWGRIPIPLPSGGDQKPHKDHGCLLPNRWFYIQLSTVSRILWILLLMAEILHHLGCMKPYK